MIGPLLPHHDAVVADFWVQAWQATMPEIDFSARRSWLLAHLGQMRETGEIVRAFVEYDMPLGFYSLFPAAGLLEQICVCPTAVGKGIGALLIGDAANHTHCTLNLVVNEDNYHARQFYTRLRFIETGRGLNTQGTRATITMEMGRKWQPKTLEAGTSRH